MVDSRAYNELKATKEEKISTMTTMTLDELKNLPPLTEHEKQLIRNAKPTPSESDKPVLDSMCEGKKETDVCLIDESRCRASLPPPS